MLERNCRGCDHFVDSGHSVGTCRRYPQYQNRSPNDRCGEFSALAHGEPDMLALPVVDMAQVEKAFDDAHIEYAKTKRKYTKRAAT
jgi:hypothetical protein